VMEIVARDRPGLLFEIASTLTELKCNIDVALIDTEGQKAIDVLYLTREGQKLGSEAQREFREVLLGKL